MSAILFVSPGMAVKFTNDISDVVPMVFSGWTSVADVGLAGKRYWFNAGFPHGLENQEFETFLESQL